MNCYELILAMHEPGYHAGSREPLVQIINYVYIYVYHKW